MPPPLPVRPPPTHPPTVLARAAVTSPPPSLPPHPTPNRPRYPDVISLPPPLHPLPPHPPQLTRLRYRHVTPFSPGTRPALAGDFLDMPPKRAAQDTCFGVLDSSTYEPIHSHDTERAVIQVSQFRQTLCAKYVHIIYQVYDIRTRKTKVSIHDTAGYCCTSYIASVRTEMVALQNPEYFIIWYPTNNIYKKNCFTADPGAGRISLHEVLLMIMISTMNNDVQYATKRGAN